MADCHIGGWRQPELRELSIKSFKIAVDICIERHIGFVLISGDLFNTALPSIELIKNVAEILRKLKDHDISVYVIPGSHDFSPGGKTMLDVLEKAGLVENVVKFSDGNLEFTIDKTNTKITGMLGLRGGLEKNYYKILNKKALENEKGFKIFMFHTALEEFKPKDLEQVECQSVVTLPKNFDYYAGGHVHYIFDTRKKDYGLITFPGALFPNNFKELEEFKHGGFYVVDDKLNLEYVSVNLKDVVSLKLDVNDKNVAEAEKIISERVRKADVKDKIITLRVEGILKSGKPSDIKFKEMLVLMKDAYIVLKNTNKLTSKEFEEIKIEGGNIDEIEEKVTKDYLEKNKPHDLNLEKLTPVLIKAFDKEKGEGEKNIDFENRIISEVVKIFDLERLWKDEIK